MHPNNLGTWELGNCNLYRKQVGFIKRKDVSMTWNMIDEMYGREIPATEENNVTYVAMRPIVEALGLKWKSQRNKIKNKFGGEVKKFTMSNGRNNKYLAINEWLMIEWAYSVNPLKICGKYTESSLVIFKRLLELELEKKAMNTMLQARTARLGNEYKDVPLVNAELHIMERIRAKNLYINPHIAFIAYGFIKDQVKNELDAKLYNKNRSPNLSLIF